MDIVPPAGPGAQNRGIGMEKTGIKLAAQNRKAFHEYFVEERFEAGIELAGT